MTRKKSSNPFEDLANSLIATGIKHLGKSITESLTTKPSPVIGSEAWIRDCLAEKLNGKTEVVIEGIGRIDILTKKEIIEVKRVSGWKSAIGQVKSYGKYYPKHRLRVHLFGDMTERRLKTIQEHCKDEGITLTWE
jgi:hypothetical protein